MTFKQPPANPCRKHVGLNASPGPDRREYAEGNCGYGTEIIEPLQRLAEFANKAAGARPFAGRVGGPHAPRQIMATKAQTSEESRRLYGSLSRLSERYPWGSDDYR